MREMNNVLSKTSLLSYSCFLIGMLKAASFVYRSPTLVKNMISGLSYGALNASYQVRLVEKHNCFHYSKPSLLGEYWVGCSKPSE